MEVHLTKLALTRNARRLTLDSQAMHRTIAYAAGERTLWALPSPHQLIVQSSHPIDTAKLDGLVAEHHTNARRTRHAIGVRLHLALIANPTRQEFTHDTRGKRHPIPADDIPDWVTRKLGDAVNLHTIDVTPLGGRHGRRHSDRVTHHLAAIHATGTVTNPDLLENLIITGVGRAKAYGAGLLLTREIPA